MSKVDKNNEITLYRNTLLDVCRIAYAVTLDNINHLEFIMMNVKKVK